MTNRKQARKTKIAIIGAGSMGMLFYSLLCKNKLLSLYFVETRKRLPNGEKNFKFSYYSSPQTNSLIKSFNSVVKSIDSIKDADLVLITTKSFDISQTINSITPYLSNNCLLLTVCNGYGFHNKIKDKNILKKLFFGSTTHGAHKNTNTVTHAGHGITFIGCATPYTSKASISLIKNIFKTLKDTKFTNNITIKMLLKLSINAVINPLSALHSCKNGELLQHMKDIENVINEIYTPLTLMGLNLTKNEMTDAILKVIHNTHNNYSSMQQDFSNNRKSELQYILLPILQKAKENNISLNFTLDLYNKLSKTESK